MKDITKFSREFLKGPRKKCEDCGFIIPILRGVPDKTRKLECPECGAIYRVLFSGNEFRFIKFPENNK